MKKIGIYLSIISMILGLSAFSCASTEITSAKLYIQQKNLDKAEEILLKEIKKNPGSDEGHYLLGYVQGDKGNIPEMIKSYDKSLSISKKFSKEINNSKKYIWANNFNAGVAYFNRASKAGTKDSISMYFDKAITAFNNAVICQPDSVSAYNNLAFAYMNQGMYDKAVEPLTQALKLNKSSETYGQLGQIYYNKASKQMSDFIDNGNVADSVESINTYNKAIEVLQEGRKEFPDNENINNYLFNSYIGAHEESQAIGQTEELVKSHPNSKSNRYNYGSLLLQSNKYEEATQQFLAALKIDPNYINAIYNLAVTYVKWGSKIRLDDEAAEKKDSKYKEKFESALPYLEKYVESEVGAKEPAIWELLGKVYANLGKTEKSKNAFLKSDEFRK